ncbi:related to SCP160 protein [Rhynchosporium graminicola]|uniref:Related to SCP160 protein n=1 Tax=Rhynchosporium graminicola TaxID=2792576 RepID=A0A1E1KFB1_9HELO|nr:related to SCP160 protein [Rhynchosporium commune]
MSSENGTNGSGAPLSAAQRLQQMHTAHKVSVDEVPDESDLKHPPAPLAENHILEDLDEPTASSNWPAATSAKAAGKRRVDDSSDKENAPILDPQSTTAFPGLGGAPKPTQAPVLAGSWGGKPINGANSGATNGSATPTSAPRSSVQAPAVQIQAPRLVLQKNEVLPRNQLKKPLPDLLKDINKKLRTNLTMRTGENGILEFRESSNQKEALKQQAVRDLGAQICAKSTAKVSIPKSARAHIIGKQGSTIKGLQEATGARIQMPKTEDMPQGGDDDDDMIDIVIEGNPVAIQMARREIAKIANERTPAVNTRLRSIPAEFYPFLAGPASSLEDSHGVQVRVPPHHTWTSQAPPRKAAAGQAEFLPAFGDNHITLGGDRAAVQAARAEIERLTQELRQRLAVEQYAGIDRGQHQYVIGDRGVSPEDFFGTTQCAIILPTDDGEDIITFIGPADKLQAAKEHATSLASNINSSTLDISRQFRNAPGGARVHARNVTHYLRARKEIERLEAAHKASINTPILDDGAAAWELYFREAANGMRAKDEINQILGAHPPSRMATVPVDPFFHRHIQRDITPRVQKDYGVHVVIPDSSEKGAPVLLVFEGDSGLDSDYQIPRDTPSANEIKAFKQGLEDARTHILDIISKQDAIISTSIDVPKIFHDKLRRFIQKEQQARAGDQIPVRVANAGTIVTLKGPAPAVEALAEKVNAFVATAIEDEKERGFTTTFDFPQKHANQLIGKGGANIRDLRDKFDVEINVNDGVVELKGPQAKAAAAKAHISNLGRQWADEATYTLKIDPKFHRELIGAGGAQINKLQTRYKVQIHFPRSAKPSRDDQSNADAASDAGKKQHRRDQEPDEVTVKGPKKGADEARDEILSLYQYLKDNSHSAAVSVQAGQIPSLIGQRGSGMDEIRQTSGARIEIPNARDIKDPSTRVEIVIKGTVSQVAQARKLIDAKRDVFDTTVTKTLEVEKKHHRALIGTGGSALRDIVVGAGGSDDRRELARTVQFPKAESDGNTIKVEGKADIVDKIIAAMEKIVLERENQATETFDVPTEKHRSLIGRGGETKKDIEAKFKVAIDIPRQGSEQTGIKVTGLPVDVEAAKTHILDLVKDQEGETVQVPRKVHHTIADNGQFFRRLRNDNKVTVDHAGHKVPPKPTAPTNVRGNGSNLPLQTDEPSELDAHIWNIIDNSESSIEGEIPWILRGPPDNVTKAVATLTAAIDAAMKNTTAGYLILPDPSTYRYVIGQGGNKVNQIRKATGCKITVPRDQAGGEAIEILGTAEGVEKAKDLVLKAVQDGISGNVGGGRNSGANGDSYPQTSNGNGNWD